jgi:mannose/fructose/sorbose-specific phosphotransferase system IIA component
VETVAMVVGERENVKYLSLTKSDNLETFVVKLKAAVDALDSGSGVLILADMFGGTPMNAAVSLYGQSSDVQIITGVNMPVLIEAIMHSDRSAAELATIIMSHREKLIVDVKAMINRKG